jgi:hypothetical protein
MQPAGAVREAASSALLRTGSDYMSFTIRTYDEAQKNKTLVE